MHISEALEIRQHTPKNTFRHTIRVEQRLGLTLSDREREAIYSACQVSGFGLDTYYRWYRQKSAISSKLAHLDHHSILQAIHCIDRSDYSSINEKLPNDRGVVIALPHHGHYILAAVRLMEHIRHLRNVHILYGDPRDHAGNDLFDDLYRRLFDRAGCRAGIIHSNGRGIAKALRALKNGEAIIMMPDVHRHREETYCIPFLGRPLDIMLGTAAMARKTGSCILPVVSVVDAALQATTVFGDTVEPTLRRAAPSSDVSDYWTTLDIFQFFERAMGPQIIYWQYVRQHFLKKSEFPIFYPSTMDEAWHMFSKDHRSNPKPVLTAYLD